MRSVPVGTEKLTPNGYVNVKTEDGWRYKHHLVAEQKLGRPLEKDERVYFKDGDRDNLDPKNIEVKAVKEPEDPIKKVKHKLFRLEQHVESELSALKLELAQLEGIIESNNSQSESN